MNEFAKKFTRSVALLQLLADMENRTLAGLAGVSEAYITKMKQPSQMYNPNLETLYKISKAFDMHIEEVLNFADQVDQLRLDTCCERQRPTEAKND